MSVKYGAFSFHFDIDWVANTIKQLADEIEDDKSPKKPVPVAEDAIQIRTGDSSAAAVVDIQKSRALEYEKQPSLCYLTLKNVSLRCY